MLACLYIAVGALGLAFHFTELCSISTFPRDAVLVELTEFSAIVGGAFMLRGDNWARSLALVWMAFHVIVMSAFHALTEFAIHLLFCAVITWILFRPEATRYFRAPR